MRLYHSIPLLRIVPDDTKFDFMRFRRISFPISALLSIIAIALYFFHGLNFGIDFVGGTLIEIQSKSGPADLAKMRTTLSGLGLGDVQLQEFGGPTDVLIRVAQQPGGELAQTAAIAKVREALGNEVDYRRVEVVGPRVSSELLAKSTIGLGLAIFAILIYLWFRFEWQFALGAMIANVHDLVLTIGYMSLTQIDFDLSSIAALLTILGYSLNDTVVIYDRIREMLRRYKRMPMPDLLNISVNSTLSRSIITHATVTLALLALLFFGGHAIHSFVATMIFGVVLVGTYTSVFIAAPILIYLGVGTTRMEAAEGPAEKRPPSTVGWPPAAHRPMRWSARLTGTASWPLCSLRVNGAMRCLPSMPLTWRSRACAKSCASRWPARSGCNGGVTCSPAGAGERSRPTRSHPPCSRPWRATGYRGNDCRRPSRRADLISTTSRWWRSPISKDTPREHPPASLPLPRKF